LISFHLKVTKHGEEKVSVYAETQHCTKMNTYDH
jgi:hypothetical protein